MTLNVTPVDLERFERDAEQRKRRERQIAAETEQRLVVMGQLVFTLPDGGQVSS